VDIRSDLRSFLKKQAPRGITFEDNESLLNNGVIDSLKMLDLISFIEEKFGVAIDEDEMMPDNFESVDTIVQFLEAKRQSNA